MNNNIFEVAKVFGQPIDPALPVDPVLVEIANKGTLEVGDNAYVFNSYDENVDVIYTAGVNGEVVSNKKSPQGAVEVQMVGYQTDLAYVTLQELSNSKDVTPLARKKAAIARGLDKLEVKTMLDLLLGISSQEVTRVSGQDIYDGVVSMVAKVSDYGDNYVLLVGSTVYNAILTYDKDNANNLNYRMSIFDMLNNYKIKLIKVLGNVQLDSGSYDLVLGTNKAILVAKNSTVVEGKPCLLIRRRFSAELSQSIGLDTEAERMTSVIGGLQVINNHKNILGYGVLGYENVGMAVTNYLCICWCENLV